MNELRYKLKVSLIPPIIYLLVQELGYMGLEAGLNALSRVSGTALALLSRDPGRAQLVMLALSVIPAAAAAWIAAGPVMHQRFKAGLSQPQESVKQHWDKEILRWGFLIRSMLLALLINMGLSKLGLLEGTTPVGHAPMGLQLAILGFFIPLAEEFVFRGLCQDGLYMAFPDKPWVGICLSAFLFGAAHGTPIQALYAFVMGLLFGYGRYRTGRFLDAFLWHCGANLAVIWYLAVTG